jgi:hypothetical protein
LNPAVYADGGSVLNSGSPNLVRRLPFVLGLASLLALLLAGCGPPGATPSTASPTPGVNPSFTVPTRSFSSAAMGIAFRYPTGWKRLPDQPGDKTGDGVTFEGSTGAVQAVVSYDYSYAFGKAKSPLPFAGARPSDLRVLIAQLAPSKIVRSQVTRLDGVRVATMEFLIDLPPEAPISGRAHEVLDTSGLYGENHSQVRIAVLAAANQWAADRTTL